MISAAIRVADTDSVTKRGRRPALAACALIALLTAAPLTGCGTSPGSPQFVSQDQQQPTASSDVSVKTVVELEPIAFTIRNVNDATLASGIRKVRTPGVDGARKVTYQVTSFKGKQLEKKQLSSVVTKRPVQMVMVIGTKDLKSSKPGMACNVNYSGCVPVASDVDCEDGGNGPEYLKGPVDVIGIDIYHLDLNNDGKACDGPEDIP